MNITTISNIQFFSVCQFITLMGVIFSSKGLITIEQQNQSVSVFNYLFHYLNASSNTTKGRIQFLRQISEGTEQEANALDLKKVNETYENIINEVLFAHYGIISGYLSKINAPNISALRKLVPKDVSGNYINSNVCPSEKSNINLTPLAIEKLFEDYIRPLIVREQTAKNLMDEHIQRRFKRQPLGQNEDNFTEPDIRPDIEPQVQDNDLPNLRPDVSNYSLIDVGGNELPPKIPKITAAPNGNFSIDNISGILSGAISMPYRYPDFILRNYGSSNNTISVPHWNLNSTPPAYYDFSRVNTSISYPYPQFMLPTYNGSSSGDTSMPYPYPQFLPPTYYGSSREATSNPCSVLRTETNNSEIFLGTTRNEGLGSNDENDPNSESTDQDNNSPYIQPDINDDIIDVGDYELQNEISEFDTTIVQDDVNNQPRTSRGDIVQQESILETGYNFENTLTVLKGNGLLAVKQNRENLMKFRLDLMDLANEQFRETDENMPSNLWYSETTNRRNVIERLKNLKGETFFFNDITLLAQANTELPWNTWRPLAFDSSNEYKIYYYILNNSKYGFVNLNKAKYFKNHYLTFSGVLFNVTGTKLVERENSKILIINLTKVPLKEKQWRFYTRREVDFEKIARESGKSKRMMSIEKSADIISSIVPLHTFSRSVNILKGYILKLQTDGIPIPTYEQLAKKYSDNLSLPEGYERWKIPNHKLIDDVLFETNFQHRKVSFKYKQTFILKNKFGRDNWEQIRDIYENSFSLQKSIRLLDFYMLRRYLDRINSMQAGSARNVVSLLLNCHGDTYEMRRGEKLQVQIAMYRLALQQCEKESAENPIRLYRFEFVWGGAEENYRNISKELIKLKDFKLFFSNNITVKEETNIYGISIDLHRLIQADLENQAGIANLDIITGNETGMYAVPYGWTFEITFNDYKDVNGKSVQFIEMRNSRSKEDKMVDMIKELYKLLNDG